MWTRTNQIQPQQQQQRKKSNDTQNNLQLLPILAGTQAIINCAKGQRTVFFSMRTPNNQSQFIAVAVAFAFSQFCNYRFEN